MQLDAQERILTTNASRTMAAMSLGFIVVVTPATIQEVVAACTGCKVKSYFLFMFVFSRRSQFTSFLDISDMRIIIYTLQQ